MTPTPTTRPLRIALLGATGLVGRAVLDALAESPLELEELRLLASPRSSGAALDWNGEELPVKAVSPASFAGCDLALFCAPAEVARHWAPIARAAGCVVIDDSPAFRMEAEVPLVIAEVNGEAAAAGAHRGGLLAGPSGPVALLATALAPLHRTAGLERVVVSTYQAVSGAGQRGVQQLEREAAALMNAREPEGAAGPVPHRIAFNVVPQIGAFGEDGRAGEERKLEDETRKILGLPGLRVSATAVRVPVFFGHAAAVNVTLSRPLTADAAREVLRAAPGVKVLDAPGEGVYPMPMLAVNDEAVLVGRVRADRSQDGDRGLDLFIVADDLRRGAAGGLVRIAALVAAGLPRTGPA